MGVSPQLILNELLQSLLPEARLHHGILRTRKSGNVRHCPTSQSCCLNMEPRKISGRPSSLPMGAWPLHPRGPRLDLQAPAGSGGRGPYRFWVPMDLREKAITGRANENRGCPPSPLSESWSLRTHSLAHPRQRWRHCLGADHYHCAGSCDCQTGKERWAQTLWAFISWDQDPTVATLLQDAAGPSALRINNFIHFAQMTPGYFYIKFQRLVPRTLSRDAVSTIFCVRPKINLNGNNFFLKGKTVKHFWG